MANTNIRNESSQTFFSFIIKYDSILGHKN